MITGKLIVKLIPLLESPLAVTTTLPVVEPTGTSATMLVELQVVTDANVSTSERTVNCGLRGTKIVPGDRYEITREARCLRETRDTRWNLLVRSALDWCIRRGSVRGRCGA